jgi:hypothetical protein
MQSFENARWYLNPWGWWSIGINLLLMILASLFPKLLGGEPLELENSRIQKCVAFIGYPIGWLTNTVFGHYDKVMQGSNWYSTIRALVTLMAFLLYWYIIGLLLEVLKKRLLSHTAES